MSQEDKKDRDMDVDALIESIQKEQSSKEGASAPNTPVMDPLQELIHAAQEEFEIGWELEQAAKTREYETFRAEVEGVEVPPTPETDPDAVERVRALLEDREPPEPSIVQVSEDPTQAYSAFSEQDFLEGNHVQTMPKSAPPQKEEEREEALPSVLFVYPAEEVMFPHSTIPIFDTEGSLRLAMETMQSPIEYVGFVTRKIASGPAHASNLHNVGVVGKLLQTVQLPDGSSAMIMQVLRRAVMQEYLSEEPYLIARVEYLEETLRSIDEPHVEALLRNIRQLLDELPEYTPSLPDGFESMVEALSSPGEIADFAATHFVFDEDERIELLTTMNVRQRLERILGLLLREVERQKLQKQVRDEVESRAEAGQREYLLREQLKVIRRELGEAFDEKELDLEKFRERIAEAGMSERAERKALEELRRLAVLLPEVAEYNIIRTYLDWLCGLPWSKRTDDQIVIKRAREILEEEHYGLERVKERILEFLAVRKLKPHQKGPILCLSGPPGVGKTSLGQSIARAMGRKFFRFSLGGMKDEAEIRGHRRTYVGAMPGKLLQGLKRVETRNPVFMLDEIDKVGQSWRGDPGSALLEVLDPSQNTAFLDHYLDVPFDLSEVMFIATANEPERIPKALRDRMEVIHLPGYIPEEKVEIAKRYLFPTQREAHGLQGSQLQIAKKAWLPIILRYTRESGVRGLERTLGTLCRKVATEFAEQMEEGETPKRKVISEKHIQTWLGPPLYLQEAISSRRPRVGSAVGLAWTPAGGEILWIEATRFPGEGTLQLTGKIGEVMMESSRIALSYLKSQAKHFSISEELLRASDIHIHLPAGAVPKDGPSAGITITTALLSLLTSVRPCALKPRFAMTGELSLLGDVLPVGGIREKVVAAASAGVDELILPARNQQDYEQVPALIQEKMKAHFVEHYTEIPALVFEEGVFGEGA